jgi:hypothetical protein
VRHSTTNMNVSRTLASRCGDSVTSIPGSPDTLRARTTSRKFVLQFVISQISTQQPSLTILYLTLYDLIYMQHDCSRGSS